MYSRVRITFLLLVISQGIHSIEEYIGKLWDVLPPARAVSETVSSNPETGFVIVNIGFFLFGFLVWYLTTREGKISFQGIIWVWVIVETLNGVGHTILALEQQSYFPGLLTAPWLLLLAVYLGGQLLQYPKPNQLQSS